MSTSEAAAALLGGHIDLKDPLRELFKAGKIRAE